MSLDFSLNAEKDAMLAYNPPNGWGDYQGFLEFSQAVLVACEANPDATVNVSR